MRDFYIHVDAQNDSPNTAFNLLVDPTDFSQSVNKATNHINQTLDLVLTYGIETEYFKVFPGNPLLSDHFFITFTFTIMKFVSYNLSISESSKFVTELKEIVLPL